MDADTPTRHTGHGVRRPRSASSSFPSSLRVHLCLTGPECPCDTVPRPRGTQPPLRGHICPSCPSEVAAPLPTSCPVRTAVSSAGPPSSPVLGLPAPSPPSQPWGGSVTPLPGAAHGTEAAEATACARAGPRSQGAARPPPARGEPTAAPPPRPHPGSANKPALPPFVRPLIPGQSIFHSYISYFIFPNGSGRPLISCCGRRVLSGDYVRGGSGDSGS